MRPTDRNDAGRPQCKLVGAGPGDPELLTLKAVRAIRWATLLLVDDLVSEAVLSFALEQCEPPPRVVRVGKRGGRASTSQNFIDRLMVSQARRGEKVVRLKGGDPFIFGRGGEEVEVLRAQGVEVEVVHGITAGIAAAGALGAPLTHRDCAHGVMFVTGHACEPGQALHWPTIAAVAAQGLTLVIYMGIARLREVQVSLLQSLPAHTCAAVVQHAAAEGERKLLTCLGDLWHDVQAARLGSPAIVIVGDVLRGLACSQPGDDEGRPSRQAGAPRASRSAC